MKKSALLRLWVPGILVLLASCAAPATSGGDDRIEPVLRDATQSLALPAPPPVAALRQEEPCPYAGRYQLTDAIETSIECGTGGDLTAHREGRPDGRYLPELRDVFFAPGQLRVRRIFLRDPAGTVNGFVDRREGQDILWRRTGTP